MSKCFTNYVTCINACDIVQTLINCSHHWVFILLVFTAIYSYLTNKWMWHWTRGRCALCALIYKFAPHFTWEIFAPFVCFICLFCIIWYCGNQIERTNWHEKYSTNTCITKSSKLVAFAAVCNLFWIKKVLYTESETACERERELQSSECKWQFFGASAT